MHPQDQLSCEASLKLQSDQHEGSEDRDATDKLNVFTMFLIIWQIVGRSIPCEWVHVLHVWVYAVLYPQLKEADRGKKSRSVGIAGLLWKDSAAPVPGEPRFETVALSEYSGMTSNWSPWSPSSTVSLSSSSSSLSSTWEKRSEWEFGNVSPQIFDHFVKVSDTYSTCLLQSDT